MSIPIGIFQILADMRADPAIVSKAAEELGFASYWVPEHSVMPVETDSPYTGDVDKEAPPTPDYLWQIPYPFTVLARASATTSRIRLGTGVCLVPQHHPAMLANETASLDHFSGGRFNFGIGAGWHREQGEMLGVDFDHRWTQTKECLQIIKELWVKDEAGWNGNYYSFPPVKCFPKPTQRPHPPVYFGSSGTPRVFKRVAEWGDGWMPTINNVQQISEGYAKLKIACAERKRDINEIRITPLGLEGLMRTKTDRDALADAGANELIVWILESETEAVLTELELLAKELIEN